MTKQEFLKKLEKKLEILSMEEREDTINEYRDIIDEKMKHGKTEKEAVKEAGDVDELAKEIIEAYKINPDYKKNNKSFAEGAEEAVKKGAKKLSEVTEEVVDNIKNTNFEFTTENVFELIIKIIFVLIALAILKIPFYIVESLVTNIFEFGIFGSVTSFLFKFMIEIAYLVVCVLIVLNLIQKYTSKDRKKNKQEEYSNEEREEELVKEKRPKKKDNKITFGDVALVIVKVFVVLCFIIPLFSLMIAFSIAIACIIYLMFKGIYAYGILILIIGLLSFCSNFVTLIFHIMNGKKIHFYPFVISFIVTLLGCFMTIDYISQFQYINELDETRYHITTTTYEEEITKNTRIYYVDELKIDNTLPDQKIRIEVTYSDEYMGISKNRVDSSNLTKIIFMRDVIHTISINQDILEDIKNKTIYNYELLTDARIVVYANENTATYIN